MSQTVAELAYPMSRTKPFNPPDGYAVLREHEPFARVRLWDGTYPYLLTKFDDIRAVLIGLSAGVDRAVNNWPRQYLRGREPEG